MMVFHLLPFEKWTLQHGSNSDTPPTNILYRRQELNSDLTLEVTALVFLTQLRLIKGIKHIHLLPLQRAFSLKNIFIRPQGR